nr:hypothetical protein [Tanacetum cinerariifolium]
MIGHAVAPLRVGHRQVFGVVKHLNAVDLDRRMLADEDVVVEVGE